MICKYCVLKQIEDHEDDEEVGIEWVTTTYICPFDGMRINMSKEEKCRHPKDVRAVSEMLIEQIKKG